MERLSWELGRPIEARESAAVVACCGAVLVLSPPALADTPIGSVGSGSGQYKGAQALAVDPGNGQLYVADRENHRIDVFNEAGDFLFAFGWGVADGESAELQKCIASCFASLQGGGAGELGSLRGVAVDPLNHDVYALDGRRVQAFDENGAFLRTWGGGVISGGAKGTGNLVEGSKTVSGVTTTEKAFEAGQAISGAGIPAGTRVVALGNGTITLSKAASAPGTGVALSAPVGAGNIELNEIQELRIESSNKYNLIFTTPDPSRSEAETPALKAEATAEEIQKALEALPNIGAGNVAVSGPPKGPYAIEFKGTRFADTDVDTLGDRGSPVSIFTTQNGASSAELCEAGGDCAAGVEWRGDEPPAGGAGRFADLAQLASGPGGNAYVLDSRHKGPFEKDGFADRAQALEADGSFVSSCAPSGLENTHEKTLGFGVDESGDLFAGLLNAVQIFNPSCGFLKELPAASFGSLATLSGSLFSSDSSSGTPAITKYNPPSWEKAKVFFTEAGKKLSALALSPAHVFGVQEGQVIEVALPGEGPLIAPPVKATPHSVWALIKANIDPEGAETHFQIDYVDEATCKADKGKLGPEHCFDHATSTGQVLLEEEKGEGAAEDFKVHPAETIAGCTDFAKETPSPCLAPETAYAFRVVAENEKGKDELEGEMTTGPPLAIGAGFATEVGGDAATVNAEVNPLGSPATGHFEYVDQAGYESDGGLGGPHSASTPSLSFGSGEALLTRSARLSPLEPGTTYHYRLVASDPFTTEEGPEHSFATTPPPPEAKSCPGNQEFRGGASAQLPDCRAYEMVSPLDKNNGDILPVDVPLEQIAGENVPSRLDQARPGGGAIAYSSYRAFGGAEGAPLSSEYLAERRERGEPGEGWSTKPVSPRREGPSLYPVNPANGVPAQAFNESLCSGWFLQDTDFALAPGAPPGVPNLYRRADGDALEGCGSEGGWELLTAQFPEGFGEGVVLREYHPEVEGFSADGSRSVISAAGILVGEGACPDQDAFQVYETLGGGALRTVSVLPGGEATCGGAAVGVVPQGHHFHGDHVAGAVSADASRVYWTDVEEPGQEKYHGPGALYVRLNADAEQGATDCSEAGKACTVEVSAGPAEYLEASPQGDAALYTVKTLSGGDLYRFALDEADPQASKSTLIAHEALGILGASSDLSRVYLVSREADAQAEAEGATAGQRNVYLAEGGELRFIATLRGERLDEDSYSATPYEHNSRVSPDGSRAAFMSSSPELAEAAAGYDNTDVRSSAPCGQKDEKGKQGICDAEVYLYDAEAEGGQGELLCVSCNPGGGRPAGRNVTPFSGSVSAFAAARIPGFEYKLYASRALSEDGSRLFFDSFEALVPRDSNGQEDVYEWEAAKSEAQCLEGFGGERYVTATGGCLSLISSGKSGRDSEFIDASADGSDVFFATLSSLVPQDPGLIDIYDARVNGGFPSPPPPPVECEGEACQSPPGPPDDPTPASQAFNGPGNPPVAQGQKKKKKGKKQKHKQKKKHKRAGGRGSR